MTTIVFGLTFLSGDPVVTLAPLNTTAEDLAVFRRSLGLDRPVPVQYADFLLHAAQGDFGTSFRYQEPAMGVVLERAPATLRLAAVAVLFTVLVSVPLGIVAALHRGRAIDAVARIIAVIGQSIPSFLLGIILILVFAVGLRWLPSSGAAGWQSLVLPGITIGGLSAAVLARVLRSSMIEVLSQDHVRTAYAKGIPKRSVILRHALKNAALPFSSLLGLQVGYLLSGAVVAETIFSYPGMGRLAVEAISTKDIPVIQSFVTVTASIVVASNLVVDLVYRRLDPRIRLS